MGKLSRTLRPLACALALVTATYARMYLLRRPPTA